MNFNPGLAKKKLANGDRPWVKFILIGIAIAYLALILFIPAANVFAQAFKSGFGPFLTNLTQPVFLHAVKLTVIIALIVVPINTVFGLCAAWVIARNQFRGRTLLISILDVPFAVSPVVAGLMLVLLYGRNGWFGPLLNAANIKIIFALPAMIIASAFITMPFVAREVIPVLEESGFDQEEAQARLADSMPAALVPRIHVMDELPVTTSGKVDKKSLPWPLPGTAVEANDLNSTETWLAQMWVDILGTSVADKDADFFSLGGRNEASSRFARHVKLGSSSRISTIRLSYVSSF